MPVYNYFDMNLFEKKKEFDLVTIGDITTNAFIRLKEAKTICDQNGKRCELALHFGDKVPYESLTEVKATGNSANVAVGAQKLGLNVALVTNVGDDHHGQECLATLKRGGVATDFVSVHKNKETNYHYVLWFENDRTILVKHNDYEYKLPDIGKPRWLYLSSLGEKSLEHHKEIAEYLRQNQDVRLSFQPGTFEIKMGAENLKDLYSHTDIFFCNTDEARKILNRPDEYDPKNLLTGIRTLGPSVVVITDGENGAYAFDSYEGFFMPTFPNILPILERTGAGDAFAVAFLSAVISGKSLSEAFLWAPVNAMSVISEIGAQKGLLSQEEILKFLSQAPENFHPQKIM